jgi:3-hydroxyanthranilate 3,4-dioxygenase
MADTTKRFPLLNLQKWIKENKKNLLPPVSNKQLFSEAQDVILFVSGGPNTRNDFHVNPTEELFYQLKGNIAVRLRPLDGSAPYDQVIKEGELFMLPRWVPHRPQRPAGTVGLIVEFPRPDGQLDGLRWYCPKCDHLVHEALWQLKKIDEDLKIIMEDFWGGAAERRTCKNCSHVIERAGAIQVKAGKVSAAPKAGVKTKPARKAAKKTSRTSAKTPARKTASKAMPKTAQPTSARRR